MTSFTRGCARAAISNKRTSGCFSSRASMYRTWSAVKSIFTTIAQPFSPHENANIRQAELWASLGRCQKNAAVGARVVTTRVYGLARDTWKVLSRSLRTVSLAIRESSKAVATRRVHMKSSYLLSAIESITAQIQANLVARPGCFEASISWPCHLRLYLDYRRPSKSSATGQCRNEGQKRNGVHARHPYMMVGPHAVVHRASCIVHRV